MLFCTHFITIMNNIYETNLRTWERSSIVDNTRVNLKTARLLNIPHIRCCNHKFNLSMKSMIEKIKLLNNTINGIENTMNQAKELKNSAVLRTVTDL